MGRWYIGCVMDYCTSDYRYEAFPFPRTPKEEDTPRYSYVIGPFDTKRGALWAEKYGVRNPHFGCVGDAERIALAIISTPAAE
jgi:hypothetical protein